jgi:hypothetical protein
MAVCAGGGIEIRSAGFSTTSILVFSTTKIL